jgi:hypothetical protein
MAPSALSTHLSRVPLGSANVSANSSAKAADSRSTDLISEAHQKLKQADHMVSVTYPLLKEPKLLLSNLDNLFQGVSLAMKAVLQFERSRRTLPLFGEGFASQFNVFATRIVPQYDINKKYVQFIAHLKEFVDHHKKSAVEFRRKESYVMASDDYDIKALTPELIKEQIAFARAFVSEMALLIMKEQEKDMDKDKVSKSPSVLRRGE